MMKYIFCIIALLIQPVFSWYVYHKQDKKKSSTKDANALLQCGIYGSPVICIF